MAKQNFIAGGYVGKLGETVGQRWKNLRTVRVYVIPHDPKTPSQVSCRNSFKKSVPYAQIGMMFNFGAPCWDSEKITEWNGRMSNAMNAVKEGVEGSSAVPLKPSGYVPEHEVIKVVYIEDEHPQVSLYLISQNRLEEKRAVMFSLTVEPIGGGDPVNVMICGESTDGEPTRFIVDLTGYRMTEGGECYGVSCDDREHDGKMIYIAPQSQKLGGNLYIDDWIVVYDEDTGGIYLESEKLKGLMENISPTIRLDAWQIEQDTTTRVLTSFPINAGTGKTRALTGSATSAVIPDALVQVDFSITSDGVTYILQNQTIPSTGRKNTTFGIVYGSSLQGVSSRIVNVSGNGTRLEIELELRKTGYVAKLPTFPVEAGSITITGLVGGVSTDVVFTFDSMSVAEESAANYIRFYMKNTNVSLDVGQTVVIPSNGYVVHTRYADVWQEYDGSAEVVAG